MFLSRRLTQTRSSMVMQRAISTLDPNQESTFGLIKPDGMNNLGQIFGRLNSEGFTIRNVRMTKFNKATSKTFFEHILHKEYYSAFQDYITSGPVIAMRLKRLDAVNHFRKVIGPADPEEARETSPESLRAILGTDEQHNALYGAKDFDQVIRSLNMFFGPKSAFTRCEPKFPNALLSLTPKFIEGGNLENFFDTINDANLSLNTLRMLSSDEIRSLEPQLSSLISEKLVRENSPSGSILLAEISHPEGYRPLQEGLAKIETSCGVTHTKFDKDQSSLNQDLFI